MPTPQEQSYAPKDFLGIVRSFTDKVPVPTPSEPTEGRMHGYVTQVQAFVRVGKRVLGDGIIEVTEHWTFPALDLSVTRVYVIGGQDA